MEITEKAKNLLLGYTIINTNDNVEVRLTDKGRDVFARRNDELNQLGMAHFPHDKPKEIDGWFTCQL